MTQWRSWFGILVAVVVLGSVAGCDMPPSRKTFDSLEDVEALIGGRSANSGQLGATQEKVVEILGKPDFIHPNGVLADKSDDENWKYYNIIKHKVTGQLQGLRISFLKGRVLQVDLQ